MKYEFMTEIGCLQTVSFPRVYVPGDVRTSEWGIKNSSRH
jgi:hypothetical protein